MKKNCKAFGNWRKLTKLWIITLQFQLNKQNKQTKQTNKQTKQTNKQTK